MPDWLAAEIQRVTAPRPAPNRPLDVVVGDGRGPAAYLAAVITRGAARLVGMTDGRQRALSALAYHVGGLLRWSGANSGQVTGQLVDAGSQAGCPPASRPGSSAAP